MSSPNPADNAGKTREWWIKHFVDGHKQMPGTPSPDEMRLYRAAFGKVFFDHMELHKHFYTGHEHNENGDIIPGRTK